MEGVQRRPVDHSRLIANEHVLGVFEGVHDYSPGIPQADLEH